MSREEIVEKVYESIGLGVKEIKLMDSINIEESEHEKIKTFQCERINCRHLLTISENDKTSQKVCPKCSMKNMLKYK